LATQFDQYRPFPDLSVNGHQTLSENIADLAGLAAAYDAYHRASAREPVPKVAGFSGDQQFFISYGQFSRAKIRDETLRMIVASDGHAPPAYRTETVRNIDGWYDAFGVTPTQKLYLAPAQRVRVW
jgi:putative endopeptidase